MGTAGDIKSTYVPVSHNIDVESEDEAPSAENNAFLGQERQLRKRQEVWQISARVCTIFNIFLSILLVGIFWGMTWHHTNQDYDGPEPPYSPLREAGVLRYVNKRIYPQKMFQSETSDEVERAWNDTMGTVDGTVQIPPGKAAKLPRTVQSWGENGYYVYGVSMYHQLHCLNRIRKSFYGNKFFPGETEAEIAGHKNHCIDNLRQSIMCAGDVSITSWWNKNYTFIDADGNEQYTETYLSKTQKERAKSSYVIWDMQARCRDFEAIDAWVEENGFG